MDNKFSIVAVDDDIYILKAIQRILADEPYDVFISQDVKAALDFVNNNKVDLIISDYHMGTIDGFGFFGRCDEFNKKAVRLLITGTPDSSLAVDKLSTLNIYKVILKPWDNESFRKVVAESLMLASGRD
jgi:response regulator RpfG family c-di-GMP phosphodiesterase